MGTFRMLAITAAMSAVATAGARAADMPGNPPVSPPSHSYERPLPVKAFSGWYLRGDIGYRWGQDSGTEAAPGFSATTSDKLGTSVVGGFGGGYKGDWLRTDVTVDFGTAMKFDGTIASPNDTSAKISAISALFNGYLDLGTWYRMTPYIGASAGVARMRVSDYVSTASPPFSGDTARNQWNFTWAAMAGVAYKIAPNILVDVGYRYINWGDVTTGSDAFGSMTLKNIAAHEVRVGLRWSSDDLPISR
jgi:opacity protein-like surface antigen